MISHLGRYEIIEELGRGEMGIVYKAHDPLLDRFVAIKAINLQGLNKDERAEYATRFYQEAKAAGRLNHPNIFTIYDLGQSGDVAYIAMELMEEPDLQSIVASNQRLPIDDAVDIAFQVAIALAYANQHGVVVHRDIKPSNIMVLRDKHVKIADFGIAKMDSSLLRTQTGLIVGTPLYMSPEQFMGQTVDSRSDIFSLGIVLYQLLTGQLPFNGESANSIMYQIVNEEPPKPSSLNPETPEMLDAIVSKCLAKKPEDRYQNASDLASDLHSCRSQLPQSTKGTYLLRNYFSGGVLIHGKKIGKWKLVIIILLGIGFFELIENLIEHFF